MIEMRAVSKTHGANTHAIAALANASLRIGPGEFVALVGPSGSGKSTMMNVMGLLDKPTQGDILIAGQTTKAMSARDLAALRSLSIGFVFQSFHLLPRMTALENVALPLRYQSVPKADREDRARAMLARFDLQSRANHRPDELSGGQRQRVALARALVGAPPIILADEPTGNLDSRAAEDVLDLLVSLSTPAKPVTVVMVTHDMKLAARCPRVIELLDGHIIADRAG